MIRIQQLKLAPDHTTAQLEQLIARTLRLKKGTFSWEVVHRSIDARRKPEIFLVYTVDVMTPDEAQVLRRLRGKTQVSLVQPAVYQFPQPGRRLPDRPVVVGSGPAGMFCALMLSRAGCRPIVIERGERVEERKKRVERFWHTGELDTGCNVQFGEGGAGTFSDGKLNTGIKDPKGRIRFVLREFVRFGADPDILVDAHPHVGTDVLEIVVANIRSEIERLGGEYRFGTVLESLGRTDDSWQLTLRQTVDQTVTHLETSVCVLALGHSARDTFEMLLSKGFTLIPKSFAVGVRVQHPQQMIDEALYGREASQRWQLPPSPYKLTHRLADGGGVYSFCMCPGGYVVNASSEEGRLTVNGMSYHDRASGNANSAIVVTVPKERFTDPSPLGGMYFQRELERRAYEAGGGAIPVQRFADFCAGVPTEQLGHIEPKICGAYTCADVRSILPADIAAAIEEGICAFDRQIHGFADPDALMCGAEMRTSSPVRIVRTDSGEAVDMPGIYPCGEGAGYAGGITSAAVDGIAAAEAILRQRTIQEG